MDVRIRKMRTRGATGNLKAFFTVSLGPIEVEDMRLIDGRNGLFVGFPSKKINKRDGTTQYFDLVRLSRGSTGELTPEALSLRESILTSAIEEFERRTSSAEGEEADEFEGATKAGVSSSEEDDDLPF